MSMDVVATVRCDVEGCSRAEEVELTAIVAGSNNGWDDRGVGRQLSESGWTKGPGGTDVCRRHAARKRGEEQHLVKEDH